MKLDLKKAGLSSTQPRRLILELMQQHTEEHLSAEKIYQLLMESGHSIGIATVYRVVGQFEKAGLLIRHQFDGTTSVYELNLGKHHDHLICMDCERVIEFVNDEIERQQHQVADRLGFELQNHLLYLFARCKDPDCTYRLDHENELG